MDELTIYQIVGTRMEQHDLQLATMMTSIVARQPNSRELDLHAMIAMAGAHLECALRTLKVVHGSRKAALEAIDAWIVNIAQSKEGQDAPHHPL